MSTDRTNNKIKIKTLSEPPRRPSNTDTTTSTTRAMSLPLARSPTSTITTNNINKSGGLRLCNRAALSIYLTRAWTFMCKMCANKRRRYKLVINQLCPPFACHLFTPVCQGKTKVSGIKARCDVLNFPSRKISIFFFFSQSWKKQAAYLFLSPAVNVGHPVSSILSRAAAAKGFGEEQVWEPCVSHRS